MLATTASRNVSEREREREREAFFVVVVVVVAPNRQTKRKKRNESQHVLCSARLLSNSLCKMHEAATLYHQRRLLQVFAHNLSFRALHGVEKLDAVKN